MRKTLFILFGIAILAITSHVYIKQTLTHQSESLLSKFKYIPDINCYEDGLPRTYFGEPKQKKAVLLLHGYGAAPSEFDPLLAKLKQEGIPYYAPLFTGFGIGDFHLLNVATNTDWMRDSIFGFDLLASLADKVDVIGHSNGGCLAIFLSAQRPVNQLVLLDPYLFSNPSVLWQKYLIDTPVVNNMIYFISPFFNEGPADIVNPTMKKKSFDFDILPAHSLYSLSQMQNRADQDGPALKNWTEKSSQPVFLLYGEEDTTADMDLALQFFKRHDIPLQRKAYPNSGHDLLQDNDQGKVVKDISTIIQQNTL